METQLRLDGTPEPKSPPNQHPAEKCRRPTKAEEHHWRDLEETYNPSPWRPQLPTPDEERFRHSTWAKKRRAVLAAMAQNGVCQSRLERFQCCGSGLTIEYNKAEDRCRVLGCFCHDRHCEPCMRSKAMIIAKNLRAKIEKDTGREYRFITLTLKHTEQPLKDQITRLYAAFRRLRNSSCWKETQYGGSVHLEVKWKEDARRWHPHLHIICAGRFLDKAELSAAWHHATGDSFVTDIRKLRDAKEAAYYVSKYASKGVNAEVWSDPVASAEWLAAIKGVRTCGTFGAWRGYKLTEHKIDSAGWKYIATYAEVLAAAKLAKTWAVNIMMAIVRSAEPEEVRRQFIMDTGDG